MQAQRLAVDQPSPRRQRKAPVFALSAQPRLPQGQSWKPQVGARPRGRPRKGGDFAPEIGPSGPLAQRLQHARRSWKWLGPGAAPKEQRRQAAGRAPPPLFSVSRRLFASASSLPRSALLFPNAARDPPTHRGRAGRACRAQTAVRKWSQRNTMASPASKGGSSSSSSPAAKQPRKSPGRSTSRE